MANRGRDRLERAKRDLAHAEHARQAGDYEWAAFAAQQAAEKAVQGLLLGLGGEGCGHSVLRSLEGLRARLDLPPAFLDAARRLDRHDILARHPDGFPAGLPGEYYTERDATEAIDDARAVVEFFERASPRP
ncbi:MAG: HEPN domain-containing protein [Thermomicrobium sp.]|nr:HEPN domain-containing protein [Thermomicrobium sp.]